MKTLVCVAAGIISGVAIAGGTAYLSVKVVDSETGMPIPGMRVHGGFLNCSPGWGIAAKDNGDDAVTDRDGFCRLSGRTESGETCCIVRDNDGYYDTDWFSVNFKERSVLKLGRWMPDNLVVTARLDRIVNPIPLFVKKARGEHRPKDKRNYIIDTTFEDMPKAWGLTNSVPKVENAIMSYDLVKGAWLPPHGDGKVADIIFTFNEDVLGWKMSEGCAAYLRKMRKMTVSVSVPGKGNGLVESVSSPTVGIQIRKAPENGYVHDTSRWEGWFGGGDGMKTDCDANRCYAFRIRTVYDRNGKIKSAYYGKIYGDFDIQGIDGVEFLYYLNPKANDRNLEWDREHNLCADTGRIFRPKP